MATQVGWYVLRVRSDNEVKISKRLQAKGYEAWVPVRTVHKQWSDRRVTYDVPIFPCMVFCRCERKDWRDVVNIDGVFAIEKIGQQLLCVADEELARLRYLAESNFDLTIREVPLAGEKMTVVTDAGPLPCVLLDSGDICRIAIHSPSLNQMLTARVPRNLIRPLDPAGETKGAAQSASLDRD